MAATKARTTKTQDKQQAAAFRKAARELGADQVSEYDFQEALRLVGKAKPSPSKRASKKRR